MKKEGFLKKKMVNLELFIEEFAFLESVIIDTVGRRVVVGEYYALSYPLSIGQGRYFGVGAK